MNRLVLEDGRMPEKEGECVVQVLDTASASSLRLGDTITLTGDTGLDTDTLTVVGFVKDPLYFSNETESTTAGNGALGMAIYVADGSLSMDYYASCYIKVAGADQYDNYSDAYQQAVDTVKDRLEAISARQAAQRRDDLIDTAQAQLDEARSAFEEKESEAQAQLADAQQKLDEA